VSLRRVDDVLVSGSVVGSVAHMLAELIENGLAFSPPDVDVEIYGRALGGGYLIAVLDQGIGMEQSEMDRANERLRGEGDFITAPARFLGHFVVGRLAAETGVGVQLAPSPVTGVTARLALPAAILTEQKRVTAAPFSGPVPAPAPASTDRRLPQAPLRSDTIEYVVVDSSPISGPVPGQPEHTPNGLRRRTPRARRDPAPATRSVVVAEPPPPAVADSPEDVRDRLTAFRAGVLRAGNGTPLEKEEA
jgi:hypothetical protein